jgi:hypothetical protein
MDRPSSYGGKQCFADGIRGGMEFSGEIAFLNRGNPGGKRRGCRVDLRISAESIKAFQGAKFQDILSPQ